MKRKILLAATFLALAAQGLATASACDRVGVRVYRPYVPAHTTVVVREQQVLTVERA